MITKKSKKFSTSLLGRTPNWKKDVAEQCRENTKKLLASGEFSTPTRCLICDSEIEERFNIYKVTFSQCKNCAHLQSSAMPKTAYLKELYINSESKESISAQSKVYVQLSELDMSDRVHSLTKPKVDFISSFVSENFGDSTWVDVGSGTGDILMVASQMGFNVRGVESDSNQVAISRARGVETHEIFLDESSAQQELVDASIVSFLNVVEHLTNPLEYIVGICSNFDSGVMLAIEVPRHPSISSIIQTFSGTDTYRHAVPPEHLNIFSDNSMRILMEKSGMEIIGRWLFGSDALQIVSTVLEKFSPNNSPLNGMHENEYNSLQESIDLYELSDTMLIVARKL
jgi:hypothetical protein